MPCKGLYKEIHSWTNKNIGPWIHFYRITS